MNDATIAHHLRLKLDAIARDVKLLTQDIRGLERAISDKHDRIRLKRVEYTSFLNTALAYGVTEEKMREDVYETLEQED